MQKTNSPTITISVLSSFLKPIKCTCKTLFSGIEKKDPERFPSLLFLKEQYFRTVFLQCTTILKNQICHIISKQATFLILTVTPNFGLATATIKTNSCTDDKITGFL